MTAMQRLKLSVQTRPFWEACARGELVYQKCASCHRAQFPPGSVCRGCHKAALQWLRSNGLATVHSFTTVFRAPTEQFKARVPYVIALVDIDEGIRLMLNVCGSNAGEVRIGARVQVVFKSDGEESTLPQAALVPDHR